MIKNQVLEKEVNKTIRFDYLLYTPENWDVSEKFPLLVFLHGAGERGDDVAWNAIL
ncbi:MAG: hypothetical protein ACI3XQ_04640 [Eubacteriales bacterium]